MYFAERTGARVYFPHISSRLALDEVRKWRKRYDQVWIETCPHYLTHTEDSELGGIGKANPPFRSKDDQDAIWEAVADGTIDLIASDHSARRRVTKDKPLWLAAQGFPGIATILPVMLSEGYHKRKLPLQRICQLLASGPAKIFDLEPVKGRIAPGADADLTLVDLKKEKIVKPEELGSYADYSLYENQVLKGWPVRTIVRGVTVMDNGRIVGPGGHGKYLWRRIGQPPILGKLS
jgi:dihydropyrimidinase